MVFLPSVLEHCLEQEIAQLVLHPMTIAMSHSKVQNKATLKEYIEIYTTDVDNFYLGFQFTS